MAERQRRGPVKKILKYVSQFADPKFNPERRTAMQMLAAAPVAGKMKLTGGALSQLDPVQFYRGLLTKGLDIAPQWLDDPKLLREAILNELPDSNLHRVFDEWGTGPQERAIDNMLEDARAQAFEDHMNSLGDSATFDPILDDQIAPEWRNVRDLYQKVEESADSPDYDDLYDQLNEAMDDYLDTLDPRDLISEHGGDDLFSDYLDAIRGQEMNKYIMAEAERLGVEPDVLMKELGVEDFLKQAPQIGEATGYSGTGEGGYVDITDVPEYYYQDPEALRYAKLRELLEHPKLSPNQMLEATYGDVNEALVNINADQIANNLYQDMLNYQLGYTGPGRDALLRGGGLDNLMLERMHPDARAKLVERLGGEIPDEMQQFRHELSQQEPMLMQAEDLPSYIMNRTSPFRVKFNKAGAGTKSVAPQLNYLDTIKALPPEEYGP